MAAIVFSGCQNSDDDKPSSKKQRRLISELCEYTDLSGVSHLKKVECKYDKNGNLTLITVTHSEDGAETSNLKNERKYDDKNREIWALNIFTYNGAVREKEERSTKYSENGGLIESQLARTNIDGSVFSETNKYNERGELLERIVNDNSESYTNSYEYSYNAKGDKSETRYYHNGVLQRITKFEYDGQGNTAKTEVFENNRLSEKTEYTYEGDTVESTEEIYSSDGTVTSSSKSVQVYADPERKNLIKSTTIYTYSDGSKRKSETKNTYDSNGKRTMTETYENERLVYKLVEEGNIYSCDQYSYYDDGELSYSKTSKTVYVDSNRDYILTSESSQTDHNGTTNEKSVYTYNSDGNVIGCKSYYNGVLSTEATDYVYDGNKATHITYTYDSNGYIIVTEYWTLIYDE
ncbi:MAG: hypothetical protein J6U04_03945 [Salinivirgaceae bacterium]|nr:hypothetical protein [Salinivirgaceae bacterium]